MENIVQKIHIENSDIIPDLMGVLNQNTALVDKAFGTKSESVTKGDEDNIGIRVEGEPEAVTRASEIFSAMAASLNSGNSLDEQRVLFLIDSLSSGEHSDLLFEPGFIAISASGKTIKSKTPGQADYVKAISENELCFAIGPAGTGKTYIAVAMAVKSFRRKEVNRIILTRPAVEAGEKLGFLPGDLQSKVDPYMRPLYDALNDLMGPEAYVKNSEKGLIEVSPLAYMRGRTLDNAFIILDEAQNTTPEQMKMFLTRIGFNSKVVITGDDTQIDLPGNTLSGLKGMKRVLRDVESVKFISLSAKDAVRSPLVKKIITAYAKNGDYLDKLHEKQKRRSGTASRSGTISRSGNGRSRGALYNGSYNTSYRR